MNEIAKHLSIGIFTIIAVFAIYILFTGDPSSLTTITPDEL